MLAMTVNPESFPAPLTPCMAQILSLLREKGHLDFERLVTFAGRSRAALMSALYQLEADCWIDLGPDRTAILRPRKFRSCGKLWSFELKLENWKRALYQATRNQAFCDFSVVVLPRCKSKLADFERSSFDKMGIGLIVFDDERLEGQWIVKPQHVSEKNLTQEILVRTRFSEAFYAQKSSPK